MNCGLGTALIRCLQTNPHSTSPWSVLLLLSIARLQTCCHEHELRSAKISSENLKSSKNQVNDWQILQYHILYEFNIIMKVINRISSQQFPTRISFINPSSKSSFNCETILPRACPLFVSCPNVKSKKYSIY